MANGLERVDLFVAHRYCSVLATSYTDKSLTYLPVVLRNRQTSRKWQGVRIGYTVERGYTVVRRIQCSEYVILW